MPDIPCPHCKTPLVVWEQDLFSTTFVCSKCDFKPPVKQRPLGTAVKTLTALASVVSIGGIVVGFNRKQGNKKN